MEAAVKNPLFRISSIFLIALSLSIGWGIRGNFGHESGAWIPGALAAMAVAMLSGRQDWRERVHYFALFGGLGLGFGGSISYMYAMSFASSGHLPTMWYGYMLIFYEGALWCGLGGAGLALAASVSRERLTALFVPMCFVIGALILHKVFEAPIAAWLSPAAADALDSTWYRQKSPLYWFDADWFPALMALIGVCLFDLWDRRKDAGFGASLVALLVFLAAGAASGALLQLGLRATGYEARVADALVVPLADPAVVNPETGIPFGEEISAETGEPFGTGNFLTNWPQFFADYPQHLGWGIGLFLGWVAYFLVYGKWRRDSGLFLWMALGWILAFLLMPVLGSLFLMDYGGFRLMPPRSDDWAGITGVFIAVIIYSLRKGWGPVACGASVSALIGGILFATMQLIRSLLIVPGHPWRTPGGTPPEWAHYQSANWHSVLEQSQGFGLGIAFAITGALLWPRITPHAGEPRVRRWTEAFAVAFVLLFMTYANIYKNVREWTGGQTKVVPEQMKPPLIGDFLPARALDLFSALTWFNLAWLAVSTAMILLMIVHLRGRRVDMLPDSWLGRGQLMYVLLLWVMVIGNFERALPNFHENRLITEWVIMVNASLATFLLGYLPTSPVFVPVTEPRRYGPLLRRTWAIGLAAAIVLMTLYTGIVRGVYGETTVFAPEHSHKRFGPEAHWRIKPILKEGRHR
jgi:hypothetical protein